MSNATHAEVMKVPVSLRDTDEIFDADGKPLIHIGLCDNYDPVKDPRQFVVDRINAYPQLVEALRNIISCCNANCGDSLANALIDATNLLDEMDKEEREEGAGEVERDLTGATYCDRCVARDDVVQASHDLILHTLTQAQQATVEAALLSYQERVDDAFTDNMWEATATMNGTIEALTVHDIGMLIMVLKDQDEHHPIPLNLAQRATLLAALSSYQERVEDAFVDNPWASVASRDDTIRPLSVAGIAELVERLQVPGAEQPTGSTLVSTPVAEDANTRWQAVRAESQMSAEELEAKYGEGQHPKHSEWDWCQVVAQRGTRDGYWPWVRQQIDRDHELLLRESAPSA